MDITAHFHDPVVRIIAPLPPDECIDRLRDTFGHGEAAATESPGVLQLIGAVDEKRMTCEAAFHVVAPRGKRVRSGMNVAFSGQLEENGTGGTLSGTVTGQAHLWPLLLLGLCAAPVVQVVSLLPWPQLESTWPATWSRPGALLLIAAPLELMYVRIALGWLLSRNLGSYAMAAELAKPLQATNPSVEFGGGRVEARLVKWGMPLVHLWVLAASGVAIAVAAIAPGWWTGGSSDYVPGRSQAMFIGALCASWSVWFFVSFFRALRRRRTAAA